MASADVVRDLRDCGIDFVTGIRSKSTEDRMRVLDLFDKEVLSVEIPAWLDFIWVKMFR